MLLPKYVMQLCIVSMSSFLLFKTNYVLPCTDLCRMPTPMQNSNDSDSVLFVNYLSDCGMIRTQNFESFK